MQLPIVAPAPIVTAHAEIFRALFENRCQFQHFQNYLTGLIVLDNKSLANITRCVLESADKTNLSRFFSEAPWFQERVNDRRLTYLLQQTHAVRGPQADAALILDDTLCESFIPPTIKSPRSLPGEKPCGCIPYFPKLGIGYFTTHNHIPFGSTSRSVSTYALCHFVRREP